MLNTETGKLATLEELLEFENDLSSCKFTTMEQLCQLIKSVSMSIQHTKSSKNTNLHDRIKYFLDYNIEDSDVSDNVKFVVQKIRLR